MLVDAAVVVVENIVSHLADTKKAGSLPRMHIIYRAVREVSAVSYTHLDVYKRQVINQTDQLK